ncbi:hypothetical protein [Beggiatoa leptomitoformis]|uniref:Uncharacterized protein n=1 Tax=Beggiatoa leptomitoformis TaxID=288004 RepID=A0A2N9YB11_9GAMM|nr:hypothetical protein [Beggiatoa leptomitoformis]ALG66966.1 hypothetical protein AL038_03590 [Beggiatoa leptomitoformis]AUI67663.1 hypothetical protein BLE401_02430 [Beggiatoa leptomitoformis]
MIFKTFFVGAIGLCTAQMSWAETPQTIDPPSLNVDYSIKNNILEELRADIPDFQTFQERTRRHPQAFVVVAEVKKTAKDPA